MIYSQDHQVHFSTYILIYCFSSRASFIADRIKSSSHGPDRLAGRPAIEPAAETATASPIVR